MLLFVIPVLVLIAWRVRRATANPLVTRSVGLDRAALAVLMILAVVVTWIAEFYPLSAAVYSASEGSFGFLVMWLAVAGVAPFFTWIGLRRSRQFGDDRRLRLQRIATWYITSGLIVGVGWVLTYLLGGGF